MKVNLIQMLTDRLSLISGEPWIDQGYYSQVWQDGSCSFGTFITSQKFTSDEAVNIIMYSHLNAKAS